MRALVRAGKTRVITCHECVALAATHVAEYARLVLEMHIHELYNDSKQSYIRLQSFHDLARQHIQVYAGCIGARRIRTRVEASRIPPVNIPQWHVP